MKYKQIINSYIFKYLVESILLVVLIILMAYKLANVLYSSTKSGLIIEGTGTKEFTLENITDIESINLEGNTISITNNNDKDISYKILMCTNEDNDIRINISNNSIKYLSSYSYSDGCYIIVSNTISKKSNIDYHIKLFLPKTSSSKTIKYTLKLED